MPLRTFKHRKPSARGWRLGMSASTAAKSRAYTKPKTIRCASLSDRGRAHKFRNVNDGLLQKETAGQALPSAAVRLRSVKSN